MKIMYLLFSFTVGGTERLVADICNQMVKQNQDVYLYIVNVLVDDELLSTLDETIHVILARRKVGSKNKISPLLDVAKAIMNYKIEVVHCNSFNAPELLLISKIINPNCKIISTVHGMGQFANMNKLKLAIRKRVCHKFVAISNSVKYDMINAGISEHKVTCIYNGINTVKYDIASLKEFDKSHPVIGCVARIMPTIKGQDVLLEATSIVKKVFPTVKVLFAGGVAERQQDDYRKLLEYVHEHELTDNVEFLGNVDDVPSFLNSIDICVVPSRSEGFGLALVEALAMGVPTIASDIAGPKEIVENEGIGVLFKSGDSVDLANKILRTIDDYESIRITVWENKDSIKDNYSIKKTCECLLREYESCL